MKDQNRVKNRLRQGKLTDKERATTPMETGQKTDEDSSNRQKKKGLTSRPRQGKLTETGQTNKEYSAN